MTQRNILSSTTASRGHPHDSDRLLITLFPELLCLKDPYGRWLKASPSYLESFNLQDVDYVGKTDRELANYPECNKDALKASIRQDENAWITRKQVKETRTISRPGYEDETLVITRTPVFDDDQQQYRLVVTGTVADEYEQKKSKLELIYHVFNVCHLSFVLLDENFQVNETNLAFSELTGYRQQELEHKPLSLIISGMDDDEMDFSPAKLFPDTDQKYWVGEVGCHTQGGRKFPAKLEMTRVIAGHGKIVYFATHALVAGDLSAFAADEDHVLVQEALVELLVA
ncbi:MAG: PAS domain-containing protein, partial [Gammaproteobacteria bacterium]